MKKKVFRERYAEEEKPEEIVFSGKGMEFEVDQIKEEKPKKRGRRKSVKSDK